MVEFVYNFFSSIFTNNVVIATILISMIPIIEVKGAIPFATNELIFGESVLSNWEAFGWASLGCAIVVLILALLFRPIITLLKRIKGVKRFGITLENFILSKSPNYIHDATSTKSYYWKKVLYVFIFVALPFPFTGVWTGTCISICMNLDYFTTCTTVILGNLVAGALIAIILEFFPILNNYLFFIFLGAVAIFIITKTAIFLVNKNKFNHNNKKAE